MNIKKLSEITGFSQATVSNALNKKRGVKKATAEIIWAAARENGYITESGLKNIKLVIYKNSGKVVSDTPFFSVLIEGVESAGRVAGLETAIFNLNRNDPDYQRLLDQLLNDQSYAIVLLATEMSDEDIEPFKNISVPMVVLDNWFDHVLFDSVMIGNTDSVLNAVRYLVEKGHRKIGYIKGRIRIKNFYYREIGYERALREANIKPDPRYVFSVMPTSDGSYEELREQLENNPDMPTAFFADNDIIALGAMKALREQGYKIPGKISIIGFDDLPFSTIATPALTTIRVPKAEMGEIAVRRLIEIMRGEAKTKLKIQVCSEFIERESVLGREV